MEFLSCESKAFIFFIHLDVTASGNTACTLSLIHIDKIIVVETKGEIYATDPTFKDQKTFMETEFSKQNNKAFGYERFDYLYLEDTLPEKDRLSWTHQKICEFFKEG